MVPIMNFQIYNLTTSAHLENIQNPYDDLIFFVCNREINATNISSFGANMILENEFSRTCEVYKDSVYNIDFSELARCLYTDYFG